MSECEYVPALIPLDSTCTHLKPHTVQTLCGQLDLHAKDHFIFMHDCGNKEGRMPGTHHVFFGLNKKKLTSLQGDLCNNYAMLVQHFPPLARTHCPLPEHTNQRSQLLVVSADQVPICRCFPVFYGSTKAGRSASFCQTSYHKNGPNMGRYRLVQQRISHTRPVYTRL